MSHSLLSPSSASVWGPPDGCPGSIRMKQAMPPETRDQTAAREGEACHELAADLVLRREPREVASNGVAIDDEMREAAEVYAATVAAVPSTCGLPHVERQIGIPTIHPDCFGTVDAYCYDQDGTLHLFDLKYGFGYVDAFENWQLLAYSCGLARPDAQRIVLTIVQPRCPVGKPVKTWSLSRDDLLKYQAQLQRAARAAMQPEAPTRSGKACKYCAARHVCATAAKAGLDLFEASGRSVPEELTPGQLAYRLAVVQRAKEQLDYLETGLSEQVKTLLKGGASVPGYRLQPKKGRLGWTAEADKVFALGQLFGLDLAKPVEPCTPTQAVGKGLPEEVLLDGYAERNSSGLDLVRLTEKTIRKQFENV